MLAKVAAFLSAGVWYINIMIKFMAKATLQLFIASKNITFHFHGLEVIHIRLYEIRFYMLEV